METTNITRDEAKNLAYAVHQKDVDSEVNRILEWIKSRAKLGCSRTGGVIVIGEAVTVFVVNRLKGMGYSVGWELSSKEFNTYYLTIAWVEFVN